MKKGFLAGGPKQMIKMETGSLVQQEQVKQLIQVLPELELLIPALTDEELIQLETNIVQEGCRDPLHIWQTIQHALDGSESEQVCYVLVDGHNRYRICKKHSLDFKVILRSFADMEAVRSFMINNQLGRRNLMPDQMAYFRGLKYLSLKRSSGRPILANQQVPVSPQAVAQTKSQRTEDVLAAEFGVSNRTIRKDANYAKGVDKLAPPLKKAVLSMQEKITKADLMTLGETDSVEGGIETKAQLANAILPTKPPLIKPIASRQTPDPSQLTPDLQAPKQPKTGEQATDQKRIALIVEVAKSLENPQADVDRIAQQLVEYLSELIETRSQSTRRQE